MKLKLIRKYKKSNYTIGKLYIDGVYFCDTLEDKDRGIRSEMSLEEIKKLKIKGQTAIPSGKYRITLNVLSPKYSKVQKYKAFNKGYMPRLIDVKGYDGILIHAGNTIEDTEGCILVGKNKQVGKVLDSMVTFQSLYNKLKTDKNNLEIEII